MNIDLLCGHATMLHCGCTVCARDKALEEAAKVVDAAAEIASADHHGWLIACSYIVERIRALITKQKENL